MHGPNTARFVAAVPFYPFCNWTFIDELQVEGWPIRIFHGTADDTTPIESCQIYTEQLQQAGVDIELTAYPGAHHVFDSPTAPDPPLRNDANRNFSACFIREGPDGQLLDAITGMPFDSDTCAFLGTTSGRNLSARAQAISAVRDFFTALFALSP